MNKHIALTIAGSDSSGGAGIQADLKAFHIIGAHGCSVITAITAQNTQGVNQSSYLSSSLINSQLQALSMDLPAKAIKLGMLGTVEIIETLEQFFENFTGKIVLDPILYSSSGSALFTGSLEKYIQALKLLFKKIDLLTPNIHEAEILLHLKIRTYEDIQLAAKAFLSLGIKSVLIKGGHYLHDNFSQDYWTDSLHSFWLASPRIKKDRCHGTGCMLSAAITACLATGYSVQESLVIGKMVLNQGMRLANRIGQGALTLFYGGWPEQEVDFPWVTSNPLENIPDKMPNCHAQPLGLYPIVNRAHWLEKLLPLGVTTIQLRIKDLSGEKLADEIKQSIAIAKRYQARLFINDYWQEAIRLGAYGVHLGQEDLEQANLNEIRQANLRLGISTHSYFEMARALACQPSYLACGPIFPTNSKIMPFAPQGLQNLARWRRIISTPLVAIGGITIERLPEVWATGVSGAAVIASIVAAENPIAATQKLLAITADYSL